MILTGNKIGQRLRELRFKSGFTQEAVAKALCYTRSTYAYIEEGSTNLKVDVLQKLAALYQIPLEAFFITAETDLGDRKRMRNRPSNPAEKISDLSDEEKVLIAVLRVQKGINPEGGLTRELTEIAKGQNNVSCLPGGKSNP